MKKILVLLALISLNAKTAINTVKDTPASVKNETNISEWWNDLKKKAQDIYQDFISKKPTANKNLSKTEKLNNKADKVNNTSEDKHYNCIIPLGLGGTADLESSSKIDCPGVLTRINEDKDKSDDFRDAVSSSMSSGIY